MWDCFGARRCPAPRIRHAMKIANEGASALPMDMTANRNADKINSRLRPNLSLNVPATGAPTRQPMSAQLFAQPDCAALAGYEDPLYFSGVFRVMNKMSPQAYRQMRKG